MARHFDAFELTWRNSERLEGDLIEAVTALKQTAGGDIGLSGSVSVVRQLLTAGLIDQLHPLLHPIALRKGMRLFDDADMPLPLELLRSTTFKTGVIHLIYGPGEAREGGYEQAREHRSQAD